MMSIMDPAKQSMKTAPAKMLRRVMTLAGTVAVLGMRAWTTPNAIIPRTKRTIKRMIRQLFHEYVEPPHCNASRRHTTLGTKKNVPSGSSRVKCSTGRALDGGLCGRWSNTMMLRAAKHPMGRLMRKHHLHVTPVVSAPPTRGPRTDAMPKMLPNRP